VFPTSRAIKSLGSGVSIGGEPSASDAWRLETGTGFGQQDRADPVSFKSGNHKKRSNVSVAWVGRRKADDLAVLFPNGHSRIGYIQIVIIIGNLCGVAQNVFDD